MKLLDVMSVVNYSTKVIVKSLLGQTLYEGDCRDFFADDDYSHYSSGYGVNDIKTLANGTLVFVIQTEGRF